MDVKGVVVGVTGIDRIKTKRGDFASKARVLVVDPSSTDKPTEVTLWGHCTQWVYAIFRGSMVAFSKLRVTVFRNVVGLSGSSISQMRIIPLSSPGAIQGSEGLGSISWLASSMGQEGIVYRPLSQLVLDTISHVRGKVVAIKRERDLTRGIATRLLLVDGSSREDGSGVPTAVWVRGLLLGSKHVLLGSVYDVSFVAVTWSRHAPWTALVPVLRATAHTTLEVALEQDAQAVVEGVAALAGRAPGGGGTRGGGSGGSGGSEKGRVFIPSMSALRQVLGMNASASRFRVTTTISRVDVDIGDGELLCVAGGPVGDSVAKIRNVLGREDAVLASPCCAQCTLPMVPNESGVYGCVMKCVHPASSSSSGIVHRFAPLIVHLGGSENVSFVVGKQSMISFLLGFLTPPDVETTSSFRHTLLPPLLARLVSSTSPPSFVFYLDRVIREDDNGIPRPSPLFLSHLQHPS